MSAYEKWFHVPKRYRRFALSKDEQGILEQGFANFSEPRKKSANVANGEVFDEFLIIKKRDHSVPVHWCLNAWAEPIALSRALSEDFCLVSMHSTETMTDSWRCKTRFQEYVVDRYFESIKRLDHIGKKMIIGGNCQGAPIAESIAIRINEEFGVFPLLVTLEYVPRRLYPGPRIFIFGAQSGFNPFNSSNHFGPYLKQLNHSNYAWGFLHAGHGKYFATEAVYDLAKFIEEAYSVYSRSGFFGEGLFESDINLFESEDVRALFLSRFSKLESESVKDKFSLFPPLSSVFCEIYQCRKTKDSKMMTLLLTEIKKRLRNSADCDLYDYIVSL